jgi:asparagine synthase (glutamine-hydrolysing)
VPIGRWLRGPLRDWAAKYLGNERLGQIGVRNETALELFSEHCAHQADHARALWTLIVLSEWLDWAAAGKSVTKKAGSHADPAVERVTLGKASVG